ncbi:unnamed protein product [Ectocarpus sp. CCAP 1310/34]|nr:unnamed protein product [Ectocarpus sp. CCAP 1310/34]
MHILDYGGGVMLSMQAARLKEEGEQHARKVERLEGMANNLFVSAYRSLPDDVDTRAAILSYHKSVALFPSAPGDQSAHSPRGGGDGGGGDGGESVYERRADPKNGTRYHCVIERLAQMSSCLSAWRKTPKEELNPTRNAVDPARFISIGGVNDVTAHCSDEEVCK